MSPLKSVRAWGALFLAMLIVVSLLTACERNIDSNAARLIPANATSYLQMSTAARSIESASLVAPNDAARMALVGMDAARDEVLADFLSPRFRYDTDVRPWLGNEMAVAVLPGPSREARIALFAVSDVPTAIGSFAKLRVAKGHWRLVNDYVVVVEAVASAEEASNLLDRVASLDDSLANDIAYKSVVGVLDDPSVLAGWFRNTEALNFAAFSDVMRPYEPWFRQQLVASGSFGFEISVTPTQLQLQAATQKTPDELGVASRSQMLRSLPANTSVAFGVADASASLNAAPQSERFEAVLDSGVEATLSGEAVIAGDAMGGIILIVESGSLEGWFQSVDSRAAVDVDIAGGEFVQISDPQGRPLIVGAVGPRIYMATSKEYLMSHLSSDAGLGTSKDYVSLLGDVSNHPVHGQFFVRQSSEPAQETSSFGLASLGGIIWSDGVHARLDARASFMPDSS